MLPVSVAFSEGVSSGSAFREGVHMELLGLLCTILLLACACYAMIWVVGWMKLPDPLALIARVIVGLIILLLIVGLFTGYVPRLRFT
jgi:hypothetical protein